VWFRVEKGISMLTVTLAVNGKSCLIVGGGGVALRKIETLLEEGA
jgi:siroheme synthase (precorrin-2 oxidase/ferrochelatase)